MFFLCAIIAILPLYVIGPLVYRMIAETESPYDIPPEYRSTLATLTDYERPADDPNAKQAVYVYEYEGQPYRIVGEVEENSLVDAITDRRTLESRHSEVGSTIRVFFNPANPQEAVVPEFFLLKRESVAAAVAAAVSIFAYPLILAALAAAWRLSRTHLPDPETVNAVGSATALIIAAAGGILLAGSVWRYQKRRVTEYVEGTITNIDVVRGSHYTYTVAGHTYEGRGTRPRPAPYFFVGGPLRVLYNAADPSISLPMGEENLTRQVYTANGFFAVLAIPLVVWILVAFATGLPMI
ncbi:MAG: DUF3592 domain-containing protein [Corynebacterium sp.]|nr:DUF3592 domain-containing protein [Corynebacterium sp.]